LGLASFLLFEYVGYTYLASQLNLTLGVYNLLVEVPLLWVFFHKAIKQKFVQYEAIE
jgi:hypothetical protein